MCYWKDLHLLKHSLRAVVPYVKGVLVHDGRFAEFPDTGVESEDGVRDWLMEMQFDNVEYVFHDAPYPTQMAKRDVMWEAVPKNNWILVLDPDEMLLEAGWRLKNYCYSPTRHGLVGGVTEMCKMKPLTVDVMLSNDLLPVMHWRLVYNDGRFSYGHNHFQLLRDGKSYIGNKGEVWDWDTGLKFLHLRDLRSQERIEMKKKYYLTRSEEDVEITFLGRTTK